MSSQSVTRAHGRVRRPRALSPLREHLRDTFWFAPTGAMVGIFVVWFLANELDAAIVGALHDAGSYDSISELQSVTNDAQTVVSTVSAAMMTFIGVVFSISLVALQMASGQLSPRVVRIFIRSRITKATFAVFLATFLLSLLVLTSYDSEPDPKLVKSVPVVQSVLTVFMVGLSLLLFVMYVNSTLRMMRVSYVIERVSAEAFQLVARMPVDAGGAGEVGELGPETARVVHEGRAGVMRDVNFARLLRAVRHRPGVTLRILPRTGDFVVPGTPVLAVHGGPPPPARALRYTVHVGVERTFHQDLGFGLRQLADIALRALSPAVNDPTTAVQALDRIVQFLAAVANRPLDSLRYPDRGGVVRLVQPLPGWEELVDLGFAEIRGCAVGSPQVSRRMLAGLDDLLLLAPEDRRGPLLRHRELLTAAVERAVPEPADRDFALRPDRQGIG
ncbi:MULTISPECIES: DUF2254 domain-containing protein [unclassified Streptomyces]|uniref:DUF2254 domain-containing protein n=1 Tax=unclassified Streptomyces TaxID=2593676 RepID=UPI0036E5E75F